MLRFFLRSYWDDPYSQALFAIATQQQDVLRRHVAGAPVDPSSGGLQRSKGKIPVFFLGIYTLLEIVTEKAPENG